LVTTAEAPGSAAIELVPTPMGEPPLAGALITGAEGALRVGGSTGAMEGEAKEETLRVLAASDTLDPSKVGGAAGVDVDVAAACVGTGVDVGVGTGVGVGAGVGVGVCCAVGVFVSLVGAGASVGLVEVIVKLLMVWPAVWQLATSESATAWAASWLITPVATWHPRQAWYCCVTSVVQSTATPAVSDEAMDCCMGWHCAVQSAARGMTRSVGRVRTE